MRTIFTRIKLHENCVLSVIVLCMLIPYSMLQCHLSVLFGDILLSELCISMLSVKLGCITCDLSSIYKSLYIWFTNKYYYIHNKTIDSCRFCCCILLFILLSANSSPLGLRFSGQQPHLVSPIQLTEHLWY